MTGLIIKIALAAMIASSAAGVVTGLIIKSSIEAGNRNQAATLLTAQVRGCQRQNLRQQIANRNAFAEWRFNTLFASAVAHPLPGRPAQSAAQKALTHRFLRRLGDTVSSLAWTPLNHHCDKHPTSVQLPVFFSVRQPPRADLP